MQEALRDQLESAAKNRGWTVTEELLWRTRVSFAREQEEQREPIIRALCHLISLIRPDELLRLPQGLHWHREPFLFRAFKLGVAKLLDALEPQGEVRPPPHRFFSSDHPLFSEIFKTPESAANFISFSVLQLLFHVPSPTQEQREGVRSFIETVVPGSGREQANKIMDGAGTVFYSMERARRALGIMEPDANTLEKARRAFAEPQNNGG